MRQRLLIVVGILTIGTAQLYAQVEFVDQFAIGVGYGFIEDKERSGSNYNMDYLMGVHVHNWNTAIVAGIRFAFDLSMDVGGQVEHFFNFFDSGKMTGFGASLGGGVQVLSNDDDIVPYVRAAGFWHLATMIKLAVELDYHFNGQVSTGVMISLPLSTATFRLEEYRRIYVQGK